MADGDGSSIKNGEFTKHITNQLIDAVKSSGGTFPSRWYVSIDELALLFAERAVSSGRPLGTGWGDEPMVIAGVPFCAATHLRGAVWDRLVLSAMAELWIGGDEGK